MNYQEYIWSDVWRDKSKTFLEQREYSTGSSKCEVCEKKKPLNVHHLHYKTLGMESSRDLIAVCKKCHELIHKNKCKKKEYNFEVTKHGAEEF